MKITMIIRILKNLMMKILNQIHISNMCHNNLINHKIDYLSEMMMVEEIHHQVMQMYLKGNF
jgi:hypothetical protein